MHNIYMFKKWVVLVIAEVTSVERVQTLELSADIAILDFTA